MAWYKKEKKFHFLPKIIDGKRYFLSYSYSITKVGEPVEDFTNYVEVDGRMIIEEGHIWSDSITYYVEQDAYYKYDEECLFKLYTMIAKHNNYLQQHKN